MSCCSPRGFPHQQLATRVHQSHAVRAADHVYQEVKPRARAGILANLEREREGEQIDRALLKNTLEIFQEVGLAVLALRGLLLHQKPLPSGGQRLQQAACWAQAQQALAT